jgi:hypothetical protein
MKNKNLELIIKYLKFKVTAEAIDTFFENHPSYPSMASITDAFNVWKIPNVAVSPLLVFSPISYRPNCW